MATCWRPSTLKGRGAQEEAAEARPRVKMAADRGVRPVITGGRRRVGVAADHRHGSEGSSPSSMGKKNFYAVKRGDGGLAIYTTWPEGEARVKGWIEEVTGGALDGELGVALRSGVVLCELANTIRPGAQPRPQPLPPAGFLLTP